MALFKVRRFSCGIFQEKSIWSEILYCIQSWQAFHAGIKLFLSFYNVFFVTFGKYPSRKLKCSLLIANIIILSTLATVMAKMTTEGGGVIRGTAWASDEKFDEADCSSSRNSDLTRFDCAAIHRLRSAHCTDRPAADLASSTASSLARELWKYAVDSEIFGKKLCAKVWSYGYVRNSGRSRADRKRGAVRGYQNFDWNGTTWTSTDTH